eukprot:TRINITY_DN558_c1_g1_i1.p2 TRINITY_DN558_c1_g1~~TRINITY_DN558_c1_g1_i1.p2  ORF type:complete len:285 (+),score=79.89 TRINITY_DN558_c1_g1_i1:337-1191(+)
MRRAAVAFSPALWRRWGSSDAAAAPVELALDGMAGVATLRLNRPRQRNALNVAALRALEGHLVALREDGCKVYRAVVVEGAGPVFCSGHDLKELAGMDAVGHAEVFALCSRVMSLVETLPQPVLAAVHGMATAAGCQLAAAADLVVAAHDATFCTPGVSIGLFCHTPAVPLARCIGKRPAADMLLTGRVVDAAEAHRLGLASRIVAPEEDCRAAAHALAASIAGRSGAALALGKRTLAQQLEAGSTEAAYDVAASAMVENMGTRDAEEGIAAFLGKRRPEWTHA